MNKLRCPDRWLPYTLHRSPRSASGTAHDSFGEPGARCAGLRGLCKRRRHAHRRSVVLLLWPYYSSLTVLIGAGFTRRVAEHPRSDGKAPPQYPLPQSP